MIISSLASFLKGTDASLEDIVKYYPSITYRSEEGRVSQEIMNKYFLMLGEGTVDKRPIEIVK